MNIKDNTIETGDFLHENNDKKLICKLEHYKLGHLELNLKFDSDILIISINEVLNLNLEDNLTKKKYNIKLNPLNGVVFTSNTSCNLSFPKNSIILRVLLYEKNIDVENL